MHFGDTILNSETQDAIRKLTVKRAQIFPRDDMDTGYNDSTPMDIDTGDAKPIAQASDECHTRCVAHWQRNFKHG